MLVLSRQVGQSVVINSSLLTLVNIDGDCVTLGLQSPANPGVFRGPGRFDDTVTRDFDPTTAAQSMILFDRCVNESLRAGEADVVVIRSSDDKVRLGIEGPPGSRIFRKEHWDTLHGPSPDSPPTTT
jgi:sRNA-binding carbon storage regulator CsrA